MKSYQVRSGDNQADRLTKFIEGGELFVHTDAWKKGPTWFSQDKSLWPTLRSYHLGDGRLVEEGEEVASRDDQVDVTVVNDRSESVV